MEKGRPFRVAQSTDRRAAGRPEQAYRPPEEPRTAEPKPTPQQAASYAPRGTQQENKPRKRFMWPVVIVLAVILIVGGVFAWSKMQAGAAPAIDSGKYQAVFFTNGQVYFGKLHSVNSEYMKLSDIYYLQTQGKQGADTTASQTTAQADAQPTLVKLGDEIHGPEDEMVISKDQVLFYENLKADGKVAQSIEKFKSSAN